MAAMQAEGSVRAVQLQIVGAREAAAAAAARQEAFIAPALKLGERALEMFVSHQTSMTAAAQALAERNAEREHELKMAASRLEERKLALEERRLQMQMGSAAGAPAPPPSG
jgi:hypothetical protein